MALISLNVNTNCGIWGYDVVKPVKYYIFLRAKILIFTEIETSDLN